MINSVKWSYTDEKIGLDEFIEVENAWNVKLPQDYIECAIYNNGGSPDPEEFLVDGRARVFGTLLSYSKTSPDNIIKVYDGIKGQLPQKIFPFACDPAGNYICFDYRKSDMNPCIIFWEHELGVVASDYSEEQLKLINLEEVQEKAIKTISSSFKELLEKLF